MKGNHPKHVVINVIIHVPVDNLADQIHVNGAAAEAMIQYIVGQRGVLQNTTHYMMPSAVNPGQSDKHQWLDRIGIHGQNKSEYVIRGPDPCDTEELLAF